MNQVILIGRLTKDAELRYTQSNIACANFDLAINNGKDKNGNSRSADFIRVVVWDKQAENLKQYQKKGSQVAVEGSIKTQSWEDEKGNKRYKTYVLAKKVIFLDSRRIEEPLPQEPGYLKNKQEEKDPFEMMGQAVEIDDNDLPF